MLSLRDSQVRSSHCDCVVWMNESGLRILIDRCFMCSFSHEWFMVWFMICVVICLVICLSDVTSSLYESCVICRCGAGDVFGVA